MTPSAQKTSPQTLTAVMYHYVRDLAHSRFPAVKGLDIGEFRAQLAYLRRHYEFVRVEDVLAALEGEPLPANALLLTFDDAYADHYRYVFPILDELGVQGAFYPSARSVVERYREPLERYRSFQT